jgi:hypothetical protein
LSFIGSGLRVWKPLGNRIKLAQRLWLLGKPFKERYLGRGESLREKQSSFRSTEQLIPLNPLPTCLSDEKILSLLYLTRRHLRPLSPQ